jgi:hypothetical protein
MLRIHRLNQLCSCRRRHTVLRTRCDCFLCQIRYELFVRLHFANDRGESWSDNLLPGMTTFDTKNKVQ